MFNIHEELKQNKNEFNLKKRIKIKKFEELEKSSLEDFTLY
jgi:hypothetical protein